MRWGITVPLADVPLPAQRDLMRELADLGYTDAWSAEASGTDAFTPLALIAEWEPRLRLGTAVVPVFTRGPGLLAMQAATLASIAPQRFVLGIGTSSSTIVESWNATPFASPYQRCRDALRFLRAALNGEKVTEEYETFTVRGFRLERKPEHPPALALAALRPGMLRLAARESDGVITNWLSAEDVPTIRAVIGEKPELLARIFVCPTTDAEAARAAGRFMITAYLPVPVYAAFQEWLGRGEQLERMHELWAAGDRRGAVAAVPDEVVDALIVHGSPEECREHIERYMAAGLTTPIIALLPTGGDPAEAARALAPRG